jgi:type 1 glutamine amidotransferase
MLSFASVITRGGLVFRAVAAALGAVAACGVLLDARQPPASPRPRKHVLAWGDVRNGYQHDSISHAFSVIERMGRDSGLYDTFIRTDSQLITKRPIDFGDAQIALGESFLYHNLNYFDAIVFFGVREIPLTPDQKADLLSFVREDGKGLVVIHAGASAFMSWPEFGEMVGGRFDQHPWGITDASILVEDPAFPGMEYVPNGTVIHSEHYQTQGFSRDRLRIIARLDPTKLDLAAPLVHRTDGDFPVAWAHMYGNGRVYYNNLGHTEEEWDLPVVQRMYFGAIKWALRLVDADVTPRPLPASATPVARPPTAPLRTGDQTRHYHFADADRDVPYRLYVPRTWSPSRHLPLVIVLHADGEDQNGPFDDEPAARRGTLAREADRHGFVVVSPAGAGGTFGEGLGEKDVTNVMELVARDYDLDLTRVYLTGNAEATLYLAGKYSRLWAAVAPAGGAADTDPRLRNIPGVRVVRGDWYAALPATFDFFAQYRRQ